MATQKRPIDRMMQIELGDGGKPPTRFLVWPAGPVQTRLQSKPFILNDAAAARILADFRRGGIDLVIDYEHQTERGFERQDGRAPAAGWVSDLEWKPGVGLFAVCSWTNAAIEALKNREYRYHSPVFICDENGKLNRLKSIALTNVPATKRLPALVAREFSPIERSEKMELLNPILEALGVDPSAVEGLEPPAVVEMIVEKLNEMMAEPADPPANGDGDGSGDGSGEAAAKQVGQIRSILKIDDSADVVAAVREAQNVDLTKYSPVAVVRELKSTVSRLSERLTQFEASDRERQENEFIQELREQGKVTPGVETAYRVAFKSDPDQARKDSANYPVLVDVGDAGVKTEPTEGTRAQIIASARAEFQTSGDAKILSESAYINEALRESGEESLTADELKTLK